MEVEPAGCLEGGYRCDHENHAAQKGGHHLVLATNRRRCCHMSFKPWPARTNDGEPLTSRDGSRGDDREQPRDTPLHGDHYDPSVRNGEATARPMRSGPN
ncbi:MAG: hypothetical protein M3214_06725, partial [Actinomycetota bacterium]|nr:hypothetical protein [Actinomycetota bacterium]